MSDPIATPVVQFGTSRFLQAHADLFLDEGTPRRLVTVVQTSGNADRAHRLRHLTNGYPVRIRGMQDGRVIDEERRVGSIRRTLSTATDWAEVTRVITHEAEMVLSNTGDRGYDPLPADTGTGDFQAMSFPAKLYHLLAARAAQGAAPLDIFPTELIPDNGLVLRARVLQIAAHHGAGAALTDWLMACRWAVSLVDRIVSEPIEPAGAVAEPYALWAIQTQPGLQPPTQHPAIQMVADIAQIERLKLHILNLGHTVMVQLWLDRGSPAGMTVAEAMASQIGEELRAIIAHEVLVGFARRGLGPEAMRYSATTYERFLNPFLHHRLSDIAINHDQKIARRITAFLTWVREAAPDFQAPRLDAISALYARPAVDAG